MPKVKQVTRSSQQPHSLAHQRKRPASAVADSDTVAKGDSKARGVRRQSPSASRGNLSIPVYSLEGKAAGSMVLPKEIFGAKVNKALLTQAIRVYTSNQTAHFGNTKTRGEVKGSTRKIRAQKGTGGARHGGIRAPIFVGGGVAMGPKYRKITLDLPKKMKKSALISALSSRALDQEIFGVTGLDKAIGKTKQMKVFFDKLGKKNVLLISGQSQEKANRAAKNLPGLEIILADNLNALEVIAHQTLVLTKDAVEKLELRVKKEKV